MSTINIRTMTQDDYAAVHALWVACDGIGLNMVDDSARGIDTFLQRNPTTCFVAEQDAAVVGTILGGYDGRRMYIYHLAVDANVRHQKIGQRLVEKVVEVATAMGVSKLALVAFTNNDGAHAFWETQGFTGRTELLYRSRELTKHENKGGMK